MKTSLANRLTIGWLVVSSLLYLAMVVPPLTPCLDGVLISNSPSFVLRSFYYLFLANKFQAFLTPFLLLFFDARIEFFQNRKTIAALMTFNWALWVISFGYVFLLAD
ncbi:MAG: hypothetical protein IJL92_01265 [Thermoguttaceae bacterium]|nr:hypothetical protein [Thermoguttaceae bacterium]